MENDMKKSGRGLKMILVSIVVVLYLIAWGFNILARWDVLGYKYLTITEPWSFLLNTVVIHMIPLVVLVLFAVSAYKGKKGRAITFGILFVPLIVLAFLWGTMELLASPTTCSYTNDVKNFGKYDEYVAMQFSERTVFPDEVYEGAEDVQYCYYYRSASDELAYISVSWKISDEQMFQNYIQNYVETPLTEDTYNSGWLQKGEAYRSAVLVDDRTNQVAFVVACCHDIETLLPSSADDAIRSYKEIEEIYMAS